MVEEYSSARTLLVKLLDRGEGFTFVGILNWSGFVSSMLLFIEFITFFPPEFSEMDLIFEEKIDKILSHVRWVKS